MLDRCGWYSRIGEGARPQRAVELIVRRQDKFVASWMEKQDEAFNRNNRVGSGCKRMHNYEAWKRDIGTTRLRYCGNPGH
ncbi:hypothetical protein MICAD_3760024 [Microcystis aeruginosa PCC 7941]|nr:hypothetical protein MICAD_3760024 [Microcystis aeruginosa PCC 7941]